MTTLRTMPVTAWSVPLLVILLSLFTGCGDDGENNDTLFTGLSGVVIVVVVVALIWRWSRRRGG